MSVLACVIGDMDLVRPLGETGIGCFAVVPRGDPARYSRFARGVIDADRPRLVERLIEFARTQRRAPVLFYEADWSLTMVSENRERLASAFRFVLPQPELVEDLVDKERFLALAERHGLPVPRSQKLRPAAGGDPGELAVSCPVVVKPLPWRDLRWDALVGPTKKALRVDDRERLAALWPKLAERKLEVLVQELVPGPETCVESYHAYVDRDGEIAGEFTGRKVRTLPPEFGGSTALETTDADDVRSAGRDVVRKLGFRGVLKIDYKRAPDGALRLLEVNPRFSMWHSLGAAAGVNIPALVVADLAGEPRPPAGPARPGVTWCDPAPDLSAAREHGISTARWLRWAALSCDVTSATHWRDPMPFLRGKVWQRMRSRVRG
jgi:D-aspartate ligase